MYVIATAGHVDHGKSTLVRSLTGMEPDRWAEERERGLTINLGFGWTTLDDGSRVAFVDVPGHERFVPNMLAGVGPAPAVLFVVAADEGWMPQSEEHLAALHALDVRHGVLAVTRADIADPAPATRQAHERIARTSLGTPPAVAVSGVTGHGLSELRTELSRLVAGLPTADLAGDVRLWIDRAFTIGGAGTVVTGTLRAGTLRTGDELVLATTGQRMRVRGLQTLGETSTEVGAVARVAVNLRGIDRDAVGQGDALLTPDAWLMTDEIDVALDPAELPADELPRQPILHIGSTALAVRIRPLGPHAARLSLRRPLPLRAGDRALLRDPGRHQILAGATVLDVRPPPLAHRGAARSRGLVLADAARSSHAAAQAHLAHRVAVTEAELRAMGMEPVGTSVGAWRVDPDRWKKWVIDIRTEVEQWCVAHPLESGPPAKAVAGRLGLPSAELVEPLARAAGLVLDKGVVRRADAATSLPAPTSRAVDQLANELRREPFVAPDAHRLKELGLGPKELGAAVRAGKLLKVSDGIVLLPGADRRAAEILRELPDPFTLSQARQALGTTRRVAVPLLELLDRAGVTQRFPDDTRRVR
ncbi:selenocysteine-specific translation elongation factor [Haloechinothrix halophila]|uniref:selenocysteine-specific translation elongation factor n=1 Tax=Haloechinothrix halophila TaxID=1069073 RepID=UPI00040301F1|nr:selenocysteine-specific translation elongation factor [Haloechinothrix halophila]